MKTKQRYSRLPALFFLSAFILWTVLVCTVDVGAIGPQGSTVGFASLNQYVHALTGVHLSVYHITDWLGLVPLALAACFGCFGLIQWTKRKRLLKVDGSILLLGGFYITVLASFLFFENFVVNYRPLLINGRLEASYPSSTTLLTMCVMPTAIMQFLSRIRNKPFRRWLVLSLSAFTVFMVFGRLLSGVHWFTDIVGGALLSAGLVLTYRYLCKRYFSQQ